ncbi:MAG: tyrosine-type recombinase/integrase [Nocardioidaceae bacterium]
MTQKAWRPPERGTVTLGVSAANYIDRPDLRLSTKALYASTWSRHLEPTWGSMTITEVTPERVRAWHSHAARTTGPTALAIAYRLLRSILNVAVDDGVVETNPCRIKSAATPKAAIHARALTAAEVLEIADAMPARYRVLVLVLGFGGLRFGEATALRRQDVGANGAQVTVERTARYVQGSWLVGPPKAEAGRRTVALPAFVAKAVKQHLSTFVAREKDALVFGTSSGSFVAGSNFGKTFGRAVQQCGLPPARVHWLRHTGATLAASTGASTKDLMHRLGHASADAALTYQHAASTRDSEIARALDALVNPP